MKYRYMMASLLAVVMGACIENTSEPGTDPISRIKFKTEFDNEGYRADRWSEFTLECPKIEQENEDKPLSYRWDINYKTVSTEKDLKFVCNELTPPDMGSFDCRLTVSNEDGSSWRDFKLTVTSPYQEGLLIMSKTGEGGTLSFKREDKKDQPFQLDVYKINNPDFPLGKDYKAMVLLDEHLYIASENPVRVMKVNKQTMEAFSMIDYPEDHIGYIGEPQGGGYSTLYFFDNGRMLELDGAQDAFMNMYQQAYDDLYPGTELFNKSIFANEQLLTYNNTDGLLLKDASMPTEVFPELFRGKKLIDFVSCQDRTRAIVVAQAPGAAPDLVYLDPVDPALLLNTSTAGSGITADSKFLASQQYSRLYYSVGNKIYIHDYTGTDFPAQPALTVGNDGDVIKAFVLADGDKKLYVAWESAGGSGMKGNATCFDMEKREPLWEEKGIAGEIIQMIYKAE